MRTGCASARNAEKPDFKTPSKAGVVADHETAPAVGDALQQVGRTEVAVGNPQIVGLDPLQQVGEQRPLLGMAVLTGQYVDGQPPDGVEQDQAQPRQRGRRTRAGFPDAVLAGPQVVAVHDLDPVAGQPLLATAAQFVDQGPAAAGREADQLRRDAEFDPLQLLVDGLEGDGELLGLILEGGLDVRLDAAHHQAHQIHQGGEQQLPGVLLLGRSLEQGVELVGGQGVFDGPADHDAQRTTLDETVEDGVQDHGWPPARMRNSRTGGILANSESP
jgi:hypothetical protein